MTEELEWWQKAIIYQIYPRSFQDFNGDGIGDIKGIVSRLDHFSYINVDVLWLSPIYKSPMADFGYDVSDHKDIDPIFGTLSDVDELIKALHDRGMKLVLDFIPNHTSDEHRWFQESRKPGDDNPYKDYYIWHEGIEQADGTRTPPNNWLSRFGGPGWTWDDKRQAYYYHQYLSKMPDLNYRNTAVRNEMEGVLRFWLDRGVDGFRIDAVRAIYEAEDLSLNEPRSFDPAFKEDQWGYLSHPFTQHHSEVHSLVHSWRRVLDQYRQQNGKYIFLIAQVYDAELIENMKYYHSGCDMPFNFHLMPVKPNSDAKWFRSAIKTWMKRVPPGKWPGFVLSNHDGPRITTRKGEVYVDALNILLLSLPGTPTTYQAEEIGQLDISLTYEETQDPKGRNAGKDDYRRFSRDPSRGPVQWSGECNGGFSTFKKTWLPIHPNYRTKNVQVQIQDSSGLSSIQIYRKMALLRQQAPFMNARIQFLMEDNDVLSYIRCEPNNSNAYLVALNLGVERAKVPHDEVLREYGQYGILEVRTRGLSNDNEEGCTVDFNNDLMLEPGDGIVVRMGATDKME